MLGVGETDQQELQTLRGLSLSVYVSAYNLYVCIMYERTHTDMHRAVVECVTLGQYMQPTKWHLNVTPVKTLY